MNYYHPRPVPLNEHDYFSSTWDVGDDPTRSTSVLSDGVNEIDDEGLQVSFFHF